MCASVWYCFPCCCGLNGHSPIFQVSSRLLGHPMHLGLQDWVPGPDDSALSSEFASLSLLIGPGVQELLLRVIHTEQGKDWGFKLGGHGIFPKGHKGI